MVKVSRHTSQYGVSAVHMEVPAGTKDIVYSFTEMCHSAVSLTSILLKKIRLSYGLCKL